MPLSHIAVEFARLPWVGEPPGMQPEVFARFPALAEVWALYLQHRRRDGLLPRGAVRMEAFTPATLPWLSLFDIDAAGTVSIRLWGGRLLHPGQPPFRGCTIETVVAAGVPVLLDAYRCTIRHAALTARPVYSEVGLVTPRDQLIVSHRLTLPLLTAENGGRQVLACQTYRAPKGFKRDVDPANWQGRWFAHGWEVRG